ncbi:MAG: cytochrome c-type biosis protein CcmE [Actinomycetota bacterium]|jgi:cytochrome c-type biogenesis protein CcmE
MKPRLIVVLALVLGACAFLLVKGLGDATVFFKNADEVSSASQRASLGTKRFRLQGTVEEKSEDSTGVDFVVEYHCAKVRVHHVGDPPELFKVGIPVVLEGSFAKGSDVYESDKIFVKHTSEYRVKEGDRLALAENEACAK